MHVILHDIFYTVNTLICGWAGAWGSIELLNGLRDWALGSLGRGLGPCLEYGVLGVLNSIKYKSFPMSAFRYRSKRKKKIDQEFYLSLSFDLVNCS